MSVDFQAHNLKQSMLHEVLEGLSQEPKEIPCKFFYDQKGSALFDRICELDEYYLTRTELLIMKNHVGEMAAAIGPRAALIEFGSGSSLKTRILLNHLQDLSLYVPIDISREHLRGTVEELKKEYTDLDIQGVCADYTDSIEIPRAEHPVARKVVYFPGSTIGNFLPEEADAFLHRFRKLAGDGGGLLIGIDRKKDTRVLEAAYNDSEGVTAEFNLNLLTRFNRELGTDFDKKGFEHLAFYNPEKGRMEIYLESKVDQKVKINGSNIAFTKGEKVHTEYSHKYSVEEFATKARPAGWELERTWTDSQDYFSVLLFRAV